MNFFSFLKISSLKFHAPRKAKRTLCGIPSYLKIGICVPGVNLPTLVGVVSKK
jgi:hypothetical protein